MPEQEDERISKQAIKYKKLEEEFEDTRKKIVKTIKERRKSEKNFLEVIEKQMGYWKDQLKNTDPEKNKERYDELKEKIKSEKSLIKQIKDELNRIEEELKLEEEHKEKEEQQ